MSKNVARVRSLTVFPFVVLTCADHVAFFCNSLTMVLLVPLDGAASPSHIPFDSFAFAVRVHRRWLCSSQSDFLLRMLVLLLAGMNLLLHVFRLCCN